MKIPTTVILIAETKIVAATPKRLFLEAEMEALLQAKLEADELKTEMSVWSDGVDEERDE